MIAILPPLENYLTARSSELINEPNVHFDKAKENRSPTYS
jgi:hypothetical protein